MPRMKMCSCGKVIPERERCTCKKEADRARNRRKDERNPEEKKFFNSAKWKNLRKTIISRDVGICQRCFYKFNRIEGLNLEIHHIKPRSKFPELRFEESNLITLCKSCNTQLGTKGELDFKWEVDEWEPVLY